MDHRWQAHQDAPPTGHHAAVRRRPHRVHCSRAGQGAVLRGEAVGAVRRQALRHERGKGRRRRKVGHAGVGDDRPGAVRGRVQERRVSAGDVGQGLCPAGRRPRQAGGPRPLQRRHDRQQKAVQSPGRPAPARVHQQELPEGRVQGQQRSDAAQAAVRLDGHRQGRLGAQRSRMRRALFVVSYRGVAADGCARL